MTDFYEHKLDPVGVRPDWLADDDFRRGTYHGGLIKFGEWRPQIGVPSSWYGWEEASAIRIPADHWAVPALKRGFTPWPGGDKAPADWDGGELLCYWGNGEIDTLDGEGRPDLIDWDHDGYPGTAHAHVIGYRKAPERKPSEGVTPELAEALRAGGRVIDYAASILWNGRPQAIAERPAEVDADLRTFRAILAEYEAATKPVDPLVIEAREVAASLIEYNFPMLAQDIREGNHDDDCSVSRALAGIKRGMALAKADAS